MMGGHLVEESDSARGMNVYANYVWIYYVR